MSNTDQGEFASYLVKTRPVSRELNSRIGASEEQVRDRYFRELRTCHGGQVASRLWRDAGALRVEHRDPIATARGKILPLHILGPAGSKRAVRDT